MLSSEKDCPVESGKDCPVERSRDKTQFKNGKQNAADNVSKPWPLNGIPLPEEALPETISSRWETKSRHPEIFFGGLGSALYY